MRVLFLGGTGRLSKDVVRQTVIEGNEVYILTRNSEKRRIFINDKVKLLVGDIEKIDTCKEYFYNVKYDVVVDFLAFDVGDLKRHLELIKGAYTQYVFISSATVFMRNEGTITERSNRGNKNWEYAYNKYLCEEFLKQFFETQRESFYTVIRPYVTYGNTRVPYPLVPRNNNMEWSLVERIKNGQLVPTFDEGKTKTAVLNTKDFAKLAVGVFGNERAYNNDYNIADEESTTWGDVLKAIGTSLGVQVLTCDFSKAEICRYLPEYKGVLHGDKGIDVQFCCEKIKKLVPDYTKEITLQQGISEMIEFYTSNSDYQLIDYYWNGQVDRLLAEKKRNRKTSYNYHFHSFRDAFDYYGGRYRQILRIPYSGVYRVGSIYKKIFRGGLHAR